MPAVNSQERVCDDAHQFVGVSASIGVSHIGVCLLDELPCFLNAKPTGGKC